jgi:hypothetical protein
MTTKISSSNIQAGTLVSFSVPKVTGIVYPDDDTAANSAGGQTISLIGSGFNAGLVVYLGGSVVGVSTLISPTQVNFISPAKTAGNYTLILVNSDGGTATFVPGIQYSGTPTWSTAAGMLATVFETTTISNTLSATSDSPVTYSVISGTLPTGTTLNANTGVVSGTAGEVFGPTTYNFTVAAIDGESQDTNRNFSYTVNPDVVSWSSPADGATYISTVGSAFSQELSATSVMGKAITYTANALPTGLSITGANITGTLSAASSISTLITATAATTNKTATRTLNWNITQATSPTSVEYLIVAGGGGGGGAYSGIGGEGGGGGAGGVLTGTTATTPQTYIITVGSGGAPGDGGTSQNQRGREGTSSSAFGIVAYPGGGGGSSGSTNGQNAVSGTWGSGGGGGGGGQGNGSGAAGTAGQGFAGANGEQYVTGGGGGGGGNASSKQGGIGITSTISGSSTNYAGGGGGAGRNGSGEVGGNASGGTVPVNYINGGLYGGGIGWANAEPFASGRRSGVANTGGGGGGGQWSGGGSGGSGIVIVRYPDTFSAASSTTGSPTITVAGGYRVYKFTSSGTITF